MEPQCPFGIECKQCRFFRPWNLIDEHGREAVGWRCGFEVLFDEIPRFRGSVDGCQAASNETRNNVIAFGRAAVETLSQIKENVPKLLA